MDGQKKKIGKANERKGKVKRGKDEEVNGQGGRGVPRPHTGIAPYSGDRKFRQSPRAPITPWLPYVQTELPHASLGKPQKFYSSKLTCTEEKKIVYEFYQGT